MFTTPPRRKMAGSRGKESNHTIKSTTAKRNTQSGRSMIETLGVLAIVGVLSAGGIAGYSMAMEQHKTNALKEKVYLAATRVRAVYKNGNYSGINNDTLISSGKLSESDLINPFGGNLLVTPDSKINMFWIRANNVSEGACVDMLTTDWGNTGIIYDMQVVSSNNDATFRRHIYDSVPLDEAITACRGGGKWVKWLFK